MGVSFKLKNSGGNAVVYLLIQVVRMIFILSSLSLLAFFFLHKFKIDSFLIVEAIIVLGSLGYYMLRNEAEELTIEGNKVILKGRRFIFFKYTSTSDASKVRYKLRKPSERKRNFVGLKNGSGRLELYKNKKKWADFSTGIMGWGRSELADIVKELLARGCYNWFDFHKKR
jgi:hypothetical protein